MLVISMTGACKAFLTCSLTSHHETAISFIVPIRRLLITASVLLPAISKSAHQPLYDGPIAMGEALIKIALSYCPPRASKHCDLEKRLARRNWPVVKGLVCALALDLFEMGRRTEAVVRLRGRMGLPVNENLRMVIIADSQLSI